MVLISEGVIQIRNGNDLQFAILESKAKQSKNKKKSNPIPMKIGNKEMVKSIHPESVTPELFESRSSPNGRRKYSNTTFQSSLEHPSQLTWSLKSPETNLGTWEGGKKGGREWEREWEREWGGGEGRGGQVPRKLRPRKDGLNPPNTSVFISARAGRIPVSKKKETHTKKILQESPENLQRILKVSRSTRIRPATGKRWKEGESSWRGRGLY